MVCYRLTHIRLIELIEAIEKGDIEAVKQHLAAGADVNAKTKRFYCLLPRMAYTIKTLPARVKNTGSVELSNTEILLPPMVITPITIATIPNDLTGILIIG